MKTIVPRRPIFEPGFDFDFALNWTGDAYRSSFFNAISMSFPVGERWIIDTVRRGVEQLDDAGEKARWKAEALDFTSQEGTHSGVHHRYNTRLVALGLSNWWEAKLRKQVVWGETGPVIDQLASSVTYEYLTAVFCEALMRNPEWLAGARPELRQLWLWHASEELEHKHFVFDLYRALGGGGLRRTVWFLRSAPRFLLQFQYQLLLNLREQGALWKLRTLSGAIALNFGRGGLSWSILKGTLAFLNPRFQIKDERGDAIARRWLQDNQGKFKRLDAERRAG